MSDSNNEESSSKDSWKQTQENAMTEPVFRDEYFRKKPKKHGREWKIIDAPEMFVPIADTHAHLQMLSDPAVAIARAAVHKVRFIETMVDPAELASDEVEHAEALHVDEVLKTGDQIDTDIRTDGRNSDIPAVRDVFSRDDNTTAPLLTDTGNATFDLLPKWRLDAEVLMRSMSTRICGQGHNSLPKIRISVGVHPHNASKWNMGLEEIVIRLLHDRRVSAVGEIGLDYHYDYSPRNVQKDVFAVQLEIAKDAGLPVILHVREAFDDAYEMMERTGWNKNGVLLHCYTSDAGEIERWVDAGCYVAFGGAFTFKKSDEMRAASKLVPMDRLLTETDAPFMTPEPFRGISCEPGHVVFTAERMFNYLERDDAKSEVIFSDETDAMRRKFLTQTYENAIRLLDRPPTAWQEDW